MRIAVLGGTVFVGRAVVEVLVAAGHDVTVVHRGEHEPDPASGYPDVEHVHADRSALPPLRCDAVVDCYAMTGDDVRTVLAALPDVPLVMLSSCDVYPTLFALLRSDVTCDVPIDEDTPLRTFHYPYRGRIAGMDDYDKLDCEPQYLARGGVVLRLPPVIGPFDPQRREDFVLARVRAGLEQMEIGSGNLAYSRLLAHDIGTAVDAVLRSDVAGEVFVLADHPSGTVRQVAEEIIAAAGSTMALVTVTDESTLPDDLLFTKTHRQHLLFSPAKAMRMLDWRPTPWRDAVRQSVEWHLQHPPPEG
ncbi:MAG TPA: NAD-dependent epimerase/dehydratase family protein [Acidimicrobiales bacterium]|nr:NAD-dependent epimerase/dehydratase family protein [Acidimicrobiales bacterium]